MYIYLYIYTHVLHCCYTTYFNFLFLHKISGEIRPMKKFIFSQMLVTQHELNHQVRQGD